MRERLVVELTVDYDEALGEVGAHLSELGHPGLGTDDYKVHEAGQVRMFANDLASAVLEKMGWKSSRIQDAMSCGAPLPR